MRSAVKSVLLGRLGNGADRSDLRRRRVDRLALMYERLRAHHANRPGVSRRPADPGLPSLPEVDAVEKAALQPRGRDAFLHTLLTTGDIGAGVVQLVRSLLRGDARAKARTVAQICQLQPGLELVGDIGQGLVALRERAPSRAWAFLSRDVARALELAPTEFFRAGFAVAPDAAREVLDEVGQQKRSVSTGPAGWLDIARASFAGDAEQQSEWALSRAERRAAALGDTRLARDIRVEAAWLRAWYGRRARATTAAREVRAPLDEIPFAVMDYKQPDRARTSTNLGDPVQTLAMLGHVARRRGLQLAGDPGLVAFTNRLRDNLRPDRVVEGDDATLRLYRVDRDASSYAAVPDGTWMIVFGWQMHPIFGMTFDLPLNPSLRPIFISFHINNPAMLTSDAIAYLRRFAPVGCRDWNTVLLLRAAGVPAFFSGCLTSTIDTVAPAPASAHRPSGTLFVDSPATEPGESATQGFEAVRERDLAENLADALARLHAYRDRYARVHTSRLHCYLPARSIGAQVEFRHKNPANVRFDGLIGIGDDEFDAMRRGILHKLDAVLGAIAAGGTEDEVYATWRRVCGPDVAAAAARTDELPDIEPGSHDVAGLCRAIRSRMVTIERSRPAPGGPEIHVALTPDGSLPRQLPVVLHSIEARASRPVRAYVIGRGHGPAEHARLAKLFPTVSFGWLPTDDVELGPVTARLLLPDLLPEVTRVIHHDLDALCLADLAELYDVPLDGHPLAARTTPDPVHRSGFREFVAGSTRLPGDQGRARELIQRTHTRHAFDFEVFDAGIMVLDLDRMRVDGFGRHFLPYAERFGLPDQSVLNAYAGADRAELDPGWNWDPCLELVDKPKIAHWNGPLKPWGQSWVNGRDLWRDAEAGLAERHRDPTPTS